MNMFNIYIFIYAFITIYKNGGEFILRYTISKSKLKYQKPNTLSIVVSRFNKIRSGQETDTTEQKYHLQIEERSTRKICIGEAVARRSTVSLSVE